MMKRYLEAGKAVRTHGVRRELKIYPYCDSAMMLSRFRRLYLSPAGEGVLEVSEARVQQNMAVLKISGIDTPEQARKLIGKPLYFDREDVKLAPGGYFIDDLLGAKVLDADTGAVYGVLSDVTANGAQDVYHITAPDGAVRYMPAVPEFVLRIDPCGGVIAVRPIPGMFD